MSHDHDYSAGHAHAHHGSRRWIMNGAFAVLFMVVGGVVTLVGQHLFSGSSVNQTSVQQFQDWRVVCAPADAKGQGGGCRLIAQIVRDDGGTLLSLSITDTAPGSSMEVVVPHGVLLDPGLGFSVGDGSLRVLPYETCLPGGCMVLVGLDSETLKQMKAAASGQVVLVPGNGAPVTIPFSLKGFADAFAALEDAKSSHDSMWSFLGR